ncbi:hypothetical protein Leryth_015851 [Lithospermum erythrorhizon]|nr:hypothetical protein Leryth_015851 [Lithospermum erythrorhizon]
MTLNICNSQLQYYELTDSNCFFQQNRSREVDVYTFGSFAVNATTMQELRMHSLQQLFPTQHQQGQPLHLARPPNLQLP